jgi:hypothetical protein
VRPWYFSGSALLNSAPSFKCWVIVCPIMTKSPQPKNITNFQLNISICLDGIYLFDLHQLWTLNRLE